MQHKLTEFIAGIAGASELEDDSVQLTVASEWAASPLKPTNSFTKGAISKTQFVGIAGLGLHHFYTLVVMGRVVPQLCS